MKIKQCFTTQGFITMAMLALPAIAWAHPGHTVEYGFSAGLLHPWSGFDHLAAMLAVGIWAAQLGGRLRWWVPLSFVSLMLAGAAIGMSNMHLGAIEQGIAASVLVLGLLIANAVRLPAFICVALTGSFALLHGYAHGAEMPPHASAWLYICGFALSTAALHGLGLVWAQRLLRQHNPSLLRWLGAALAVSGVALLAA